MSAQRLFRLARTGLMLGAAGFGYAVLTSPIPAQVNGKYLGLWACSLAALAMVWKDRVNQKEAKR